MTENGQVERDLELAEAMLRDVRRLPLHNRQDFGWVVNRRANIYAIEAEIRRLKGLLPSGDA